MHTLAPGGVFILFSRRACQQKPDCPRVYLTLTLALSTLLGRSKMWPASSTSSTVNSMEACRVIEANCAADLQRLGARLDRVLAVRRWHYFPHVSTADMAAGFYEKLEAMQGRRRTCYCGEIMSFSTLECSARYARDLVNRFFAAPMGRRDLTMALERKG
jgi:hypothetical protein